jgi:hypothetical protein
MISWAQAAAGASFVGKSGAPKIGIAPCQPELLFALTVYQKNAGFPVIS